MTAVDTNVLVRLLTGDDPAQQAAARSLFETEGIRIAKTVLLETAWVVRSLYGFEESEIAGAPIKLFGLARVHAEDGHAVASPPALTREDCLEFADALHLASRPDGVSFASFDKSFVKRAIRAGVSGVRGAGTVK
jgi:predicted nucleic acid-binding protein